MKEIKEIIALVDNNLIERYKNMTGDSDELFEDVCICILEGAMNVSVHNLFSTNTKEELSSRLKQQILLELEAFGG